ncbi:MAG: molybdopterin converting factor subunit 1 [Nitrospinota bacterium]
MRLRVKCFAWVREATGAEEIEVELPAGSTVAALRRQLVEAYPALAERMGALAVSLNLEFAREEDPVGPSDEVALIPPISGGSPG